MKPNIQNKFYVELKKVFGNKTAVYQDEEDSRIMIVKVPCNKMDSFEINQKIEKIATDTGFVDFYEYSTKSDEFGTHTEEYVKIKK